MSFLGKVGKKLGGTFSDLLATPQASKSRQEQFVVYVNQIKEYYALYDQAPPSTPTGTSTSPALDRQAPNYYHRVLVESIDGMIRILQEEDAIDAHQTSGTGPCMEYCLQNRVLDLLCSYGQLDRPQGMMACVMRSMGALLTGLRIPLLPQMGVHKPLSNLVRACFETTHGNARNEMIDLIYIVCGKLQEDPSLLGFFFDDSSPNKPAPEFLFFSALLPHVNDGQRVGERARASIMSCIRISNYGPLAFFIAKHTNFCDLLCAGLADLFKEYFDASLGQPDGEPLSGHAGAVQDQYGRRLEYLVCVMEAAHHVIVARMQKSLMELFFEPVVTPLLADESEVRALHATNFVREYLEVMASTPSLLVPMYGFLFGNEVVRPEKPGEGVPVPPTVSPKEDNLLLDIGDGGAPPANPVHWLRGVLIHRLNARSEQLTLATLRLFDAALEHPTGDLVESLVVRNIRFGGSHTEDSPSGTVAEAIIFHRESTPVEPIVRCIDRSVVRDFAQHFSGIPNDLGRSGGTGEDYTAYLADAQRHTMSNSQGPKSPKGAAAMADGTNLIDLEEPLQTPSKNDITRGDVDAPDKIIDYFYEGLFLEVIFNQLERVLDNSMAVNVLLTGVIARLAQCTDGGVLLEEYLLNPKLDDYFHSDVRTLSRILKQIAFNVNENLSYIPQGMDRLAATRRRLGADDKEEPASPTSVNPAFGLAAGEDDMETERVLSNIVVLQEFLKELAATVEARAMTASMMILQSPSPSPARTPAQPRMSAEMSLDRWG